MDVLRQVIKGHYLAGKSAPRESVVGYANRVSWLDLRFRLHCVEVFLSKCPDDITCTYEKGLLLTNSVHKSICNRKPGSDFVERWLAFQQIVQEVYGEDINTLPLPHLNLQDNGDSK